MAAPSTPTAATHADITALQTHLDVRFNTVDASITSIKSDTAAVKSDVAALRSDLDGSLASLRDDLLTAIAAIPAATGTGGTGGTTPPSTDSFPADPGIAPFPSPENSQIINTGGTIGGRPYLKDSAGHVHKLVLVGGVVFWQNGNNLWPGAGNDGPTVNSLLVRQGQIYCDWNSITKHWDTDGTVRNASLPPAWTSGGGTSGTPGLPPVPPLPTPSAIPPGSSGRVIQAGPTRTLKTLSDAIPTALAGDKVQLDPGNYIDTPPSWSVPLLIDLGGAAFNAAGKTATLARGKGLFVPGADSIIQNGTITGVAMDQGSGQLTSAIRPDDTCGYLTIRNMKLHDNQCGIGHGGFPHVMLVEDSDISGNGLKVNGGSLTHNLYVGHLNRLTLNNVISTGPIEAHAIKTRGYELIVNGGTFASDVGSPFDIPNGTAVPFKITNATIIKSGAAFDHHVMGYGEEGADNGLAGGTITGGAIHVDCPNPFIVGGGTITASGVAFTGNAITGQGVTLVGFPPGA